MANLYGDREICEMDSFGTGSHYSRHIYAMTKENLCGKSKIAAELGIRDAKIEYLLSSITMLSNDKIKGAILAGLPEFIIEEGGV